MTTRRRFALRSALLLLVLALASLIGLGPAMAQGPSASLGEVPMLKASDAYGPGIWHHAPQGKTWYGAYRTFDDTHAYCIDAGKQSPLPKYFTNSEAQKITTAQTAWALHEYSGSTSADVQAALSALARLDEAIPHDHKVPPQEPGDLGKKFTGAAKQFSKISTEAKKFAGPYTLDVSLTPVVDMPVLEPYGGQEPEDGDVKRVDDSKGDDTRPQFPMTGTVTLSVSLTSASGTAVPGIPLTLDVNGTENAPKSLTSKAKPVVTTLKLNAPGTVTAKASARLAPESVLLYEPQKTKRVQRVITPDEPVEVSAQAKVDMTSKPRVSTEISDQSPQSGDSITDTFTVSGLVGDHTVTVEHELWQTQSMPEPGKKNDDAEVIARVTSKDVGNGTHRSDAITVPQDFHGWMYFTETIAGDKSTKEWKGVHGQPRETGFVPWTPSAETKAVLKVNAVHDEVTVSGLRPGGEAVITMTAYHSDTEPEQSKEVSGTKLHSQDITVVGDEEGTATVSSKAIDMPVGWVTYVTTIQDNDEHQKWTSDWGIPAETVHRPPEETPTPPPEEPTAPPAPPEPTPPEEPSTPPEEPTPPPAPPEAPEPPAPPEAPAPPAEPVSEPVADKPAAPAPPAQLPRTGTTGNGMLIGAGIFLIGLGATALLITGRRRNKE
ncbi:LPXTG cell wall anchor domain-containing protein [Brevibacterium antiquum]|uniref:LPXTG-motif cell wall anchor domain-containing protein n=1 Tax=Brevibacterium antiquum CNRZ 918 TaxID=1255637 RepID=A0A2H1IVJ3_9MICO|nr:LPXTG cell wall anchor domain-containing protein [Brevibacterium antiquum]SMX79178.1 LPXTG-motif cell wall anchor domain-containing protein [Brevibacterium antiquum CNRZ 918]